MILEKAYQDKYIKLMGNTRNRGLQKELIQLTGVKFQPTMSAILKGKREANSRVIEVIKAKLDSM